MEEQREKNTKTKDGIHGKSMTFFFSIPLVPGVHSGHTVRLSFSPLPTNLDTGRGGSAPQLKPQGKCAWHNTVPQPQTQSRREQLRPRQLQRGRCHHHRHYCGHRPGSVTPRAAWLGQRSPGQAERSFTMENSAGCNRTKPQPPSIPSLVSHCSLPPSAVYQSRRHSPARPWLTFRLTAGRAGPASAMLLNTQPVEISPSIPGSLSTSTSAAATISSFALGPSEPSPMALLLPRKCSRWGAAMRIC